MNESSNDIFVLDDMLRNYMVSILDMFSSFDIPYLLTLKEYLSLPNAPYIVAGTAFGYIMICAIIGRVTESKAFFFNYLDMFITLMVVILPFTTYILYKNQYIGDMTRVWINIILILIFFILMWIISYRSNYGKLLPTLFMFLGKILFLFCLGIILVATVFFSLLAYYFSSQMKRKKYQHRKTLRKNKVGVALAPVSGGVFIVFGLMAFCCKYSGFSMPDKVVKPIKQDELVENSEE